ncbi:ankyrin [Rhizophagus irregularis]|uniref:Ankyrin n=1 Tax=Rhizophagus irregularis TaxID=588596 RepID=A0A2N0RXX1_9GLOM|nr:ankyrin [Rhizophagus irregularis]PKC68165.1 ankyrin [Rhizophagus irregularis]CAB4474476.1 unnamed protein product [Rhizophagus irregularis]CAB5193030.1 unnamed protein product [Rhizophagus irregularis]CAB5305265.1 unnamed protein product [Rhizophagus irregularis]
MASIYVKDQTVAKYLSSFRNNDINGIRASLKEESIYRQMFALKPENINSSQSKLLRQPYLNLINVYEDIDIWKIKNRFFNNEAGNDDDDGMYIMPLPEEKRLKHGDPAICLGGNEKFYKNWRLFTESSLLELDWSNVFAAGGAVLSCLLPIPKEYDDNLRNIRNWYHNIAYQNSDIDLFIYGLDEEAAKKKMEEIYENICNAIPWEVTCFRSKHCVTIISQYPYRHIQIILRLYNSSSEVLTGFDVDCCSVGFDGKNVWALPRAHQAIIKQCNVIDLTRRSPSYEMRLAKYTERGFEIKVHSLERSRIDPTIYEKSFEKLNGLARLLVLERLNTPENRYAYVEKKRERNCRPSHPKSGVYESRKWKRRANINKTKFENNDYETLILPYGISYNVDRITRLIYSKDMALNSMWNKDNKDRVLHRHICFFGTMKEIFDDCCGHCPEPSTQDEFAAQIEEDKTFIRGKMEFIKDDPGRQTIGSFHPLTDDDWTSQAYITNVRVDLCSACARGDVDIVESILKSNLNIDEDFQLERVNIEARDYLGRTPLQLAVLGGHTELVKILLKYDARIIARMSDGKTVVHLASQYGFLDILELLLQKSNENKEKAQEQKDVMSLSEMNNRTNIEFDNSFEIIDKSEIERELEDLIFDPIDKENDQDDIIDINTETWDHLLTALDYAIIFGHVEIVKLLVEAGADVQRQIKLQVQNIYNRSFYHNRISTGVIYYPLGLCLLTQDQKSGLEIASILLKNGASTSQVNHEFNTILHLAAKEGKTQFIKLLLDEDPNSLQIINSLNSMVESPLSISVLKNHLESTELLLKYGARPYISLEDVQISKKHQNHNELLILGRVAQPITHALNNSQYRILIEAGADINTIYNCNCPRTIIENAIALNEWNIKSYKEKLNAEKEKEPVSNEDEVTIFINSLSDLLEKEKKIDEGTYRGYVLNRHTAKNFYEFLNAKNPQLYPWNSILAPNYSVVHEDYSKLLETEIEKLNYNKKCLDYLISRGAKTYKEIEMESKLQEPKKSMKELQERLNSVRILLEEQAGTLEAEKKERYLKEEILLQHAMNKQQEEIDRICNGYNEQSSYNSFGQIQNPNLGLLLKTVSSKPLIDFDEFIMKFTYPKNYSDKIPAELIPEYVKLFQAVYDNDISKVEEMSQKLVFAVCDKFNMTPFMWACFRGHNELAIKILDIVTSQYEPKKNIELINEGNNTNVINNYDIIDDDDHDESENNYSDGFGYEHQGPLQSTSEDNDSKSPNFKPVSNCLAHVFLMYQGNFASKNVLPKEFLKESEIVDNICLNGLEVAVLKNNLEMVKKILDWAEKYQHANGDCFKNNGGLVTSLIQGNNTRNPMTDSIYLGYVDMMDILIEYAAGGNDFFVFDIKDPEETPVPEKSNYYQGLNIKGRKKKSWIIRYNPNYSNKSVKPPYLFYAAYYGNIASIRYFFSERPIKALEKFAQKYADNKSKDLRVTILDTIKNIQKVGRKLFNYELFRNETPFHWAVQNNEHDSIKELIRLYKEQESKEQKGYDGEKPLTLEELLDMRADGKKITALLLAAQFGFNECIKALLEGGADPGITDCNGWSLAHYVVDNDKDETLRLLQELLQAETYQRMLEQRSKSFNHTPLSISILNYNEKMTEYLLQQVTDKNLFTYDFENNRYLHLSLREGLWCISKKLIEAEESIITAEDNERFCSLYHENSFGQTPTDIAIQMYLNSLFSLQQSTTNSFGYQYHHNQYKVVEKCATKSFNFMVPKYLPRNQGNPLAIRVNVKFDAVNDMVHKLTKKITDGNVHYNHYNTGITSKEQNTKSHLNIPMFSFKQLKQPSTLSSHYQFSSTHVNV